MKPTWRLLNTGARNAADNMALDAAILEAVKQNKAPNTLRFLQFAKPAVLIGYHQTIEQEVRVEYCEQRGIEINRRHTGGGAIFFDPTQVGWEIIARRSDFQATSFAELSEKICLAAANAISRLGIKAEFRPRNDIEVNGKKISGTGGMIDGDVFLFQGTLLTDFDVETMLKALRVPTEKLTPKGIDSARERTTWLAELLPELPSIDSIHATLANGFAEELEIDLQTGQLNWFELDLLRSTAENYQKDEWIRAIQAPADQRQLLRGVYKRPGGLIRVIAAVDIEKSLLRQVLITGDYFVRPRRAIYDLEACLKDSPLPEVRKRMQNFFAENDVQLVGLDGEDFITAMRMALEKAAYPEQMGLSVEDANVLYPVNLPEGKTVHDVLHDASVMLLPYCAKLPECKYRFTQGCSECGMCTIGDAYKIAREKNLEAVTIVRFEHLQATLQDMKQRGVKSYVGMCCEEFYVKRQKAFADAGIPGVLIDIDGKTCYDLREENLAYGGEFEALADLKAGLVEQVMKFVPQKKKDSTISEADKS